jgi:hypothetical protein
MRLRLLDVNVLLALAWPNHPFHELSRAWFVRMAKQGWASCLLTEAAFVRLSSNPAVVPTAKPPIQCYLLLEELKHFGRHRFLRDQRISTAKFRSSMVRDRGVRSQPSTLAGWVRTNCAKPPGGGLRGRKRRDPPI